MRQQPLLYFCIFLLPISCIEEPKNKIFIKSVAASNGERIDWYVYSNISNVAPDYLQLSTYSEKPFFTSFYLTGIQFRKDSLFISLSKSGYELDQSKLKGISVIIDTLGHYWNAAASRIGRLRKRGINTAAPHFTETYCEKGECEY
jgi:hypothetical protein